MSRPKRILMDGEYADVQYLQRVGRYKTGHVKAGEHRQGHLRVSMNQTRYDERRTVLHELLHDCAVRGGSRTYVSVAAEETLVGSIESFLYDALRNNAELREYLFEEDV